MKKKYHFAYWLTTSFTAIEFTKNGKIKGYFLGAHAQRNLKNVPMIGGKPRIEDLKAKADLVVLDNFKLESFPFLAEDIPRLVAALNSLNPSIDYAEEAVICAHRDYTIADKKGRTNYVEENFHRINENTVLQNIEELYKYNRKDPYYRLNDIDWLQDSLISYRRDLVDQNKIITGHVDQCFAVGFDKRYKMPVLGFRKSYGNFVSIIPLIDKGRGLINSLVYTIYHKPPVRYVPPKFYERLMIKCNMLFQNFNLIQVDFANIGITELKVRMKGD